MHTFYNGLSASARTIIDALTSDALMKKTTYQAYEILEDTTTNTTQWPRDRSAPRKPSAVADRATILASLYSYLLLCNLLPLLLFPFLFHYVL